MPTTQTRPPQPPLPPTPATTTDPSSPPSSTSTHRRRRHRTFSSSSSSSSSSLSTVSSTSSSPSPSPLSRRAATSVPFSWEHHPGIPKTRLPAVPPPTPPLPLPPPLRAPRHHHHSHTTRRRRSTTTTTTSHPPPAGADPFAAALAECTRERADNDRRLMDSLFPSPAVVSSSSSSASCVPSRRWSMASGGGVVGLLDLYGCKTAMGVAEGAFVVRRPVAVVRAGPGRVGLGRAGRR